MPHPRISRATYFAWKEGPRPSDLQTGSWSPYKYVSFTCFMTDGERREIFLFRPFYLLLIHSAFQKLSRSEGVILKDYTMFPVFG